MINSPHSCSNLRVLLRTAECQALGLGGFFYDELLQGEHSAPRRRNFIQNGCSWRPPVSQRRPSHFISSPGRALQSFARPIPSGMEAEQLREGARLAVSLGWL